MKRMFSAFVLSLFVGVLASACEGTTGGEAFTFPAYAAGAKGAGEGFPTTYVYTMNGEKVTKRFTVQLTYAQMYVGAIYVNAAPAQTGSTFDTPACIDTGTYCAQVYDGLEVNLLSATPQAFPVEGTGSVSPGADVGLSWQLYLVDGDVNMPVNGNYTLAGALVPDTADLAGTAKLEPDGPVFEWSAVVTINTNNRGEPAQDPGQPGANPICLQRIVNINPIDIPFSSGGTLLLTIDPRTWFPSGTGGIDFSSLPLASMSQCTEQMYQGQTYDGPDNEYCIPNASNLGGGELGAQQGAALFTGIKTAGNAGFTLTYSSPEGGD